MSERRPDTVGDHERAMRVVSVAEERANERCRLVRYRAGHRLSRSASHRRRFGHLSRSLAVLSTAWAPASGATGCYAGGSKSRPERLLFVPRNRRRIVDLAVC